jgi:hypothetical protein
VNGWRIDGIGWRIGVIGWRRDEIGWRSGVTGQLKVAQEFIQQVQDYLGYGARVPYTLGIPNIGQDCGTSSSPAIVELAVFAS